MGPEKPLQSKVSAQFRVTVGDESTVVEAPALALVLTMVPHNLDAET